MLYLHKTERNIELSMSLYGVQWYDEPVRLQHISHEVKGKSKTSRTQFYTLIINKHIRCITGGCGIHMMI